MSNSRMFEKRVNLVFEDLTTTEETLVKYISDHSDDMRNITSSELAKRLQIAQSTVIKFSQKLGYVSFKHMINDICTENADEGVNLELDFSEDDETTLKRLGSQYAELFELTTAINKVSSFREAVDYIYNAETVVLFGYTVRKQSMVWYYSAQMLKMGINCFTDFYTSAIYAKLESCKPGDTLMLLSDSGETREVINFAKIARKKGMKVISITRVAKNKTADLSDVNLKIVEYGNRTVLRNTMMYFSYLTIMDMLYLSLFKRDPDRFLKNTGINHLVTKLNYTEP